MSDLYMRPCDLEFLKTSSQEPKAINPKPPNPLNALSPKSKTLNLQEPNLKATIGKTLNPKPLYGHGAMHGM